MSAKKKQLTAAEYCSGILAGDRILLSRAITLVESRRTEHQELAREVLELCLPHTGGSVRIGVTGSPGSGKSSFIEALGVFLINDLGRKPAVLAIDPTSQMSRGSILGDKTRMEQLASDARAFIRPSPAGDSLGGVAAKTRESMMLCEAAGYDTILIETVGVGQSETAVHGMVDFLLLLLLPGAGDELQGIKRGIVEMADLIAINKADGDRVVLAKSARKDYAQALHLFPPKESGWTPKAVTCSALEGQGIETIWDLISSFQAKTLENGWFHSNRKQQTKNWFYDRIETGLRDLFFSHPGLKEQITIAEKQVTKGQITASKAADNVLRAIEFDLGGNSKLPPKSG